jgi:molecular chaperone HscB
MNNFFELYGIPVSFHPDLAKIKAKFYELSRLHHPDRFAQASAEERAESLRMAALNNDAYKTLNKPDATMAYILRLNGLLEDEEKYTLPPSFLMEMMDLNELISEYEAAPDNEDYKIQVAETLKNLLGQWTEEALKLTNKFDAGEQNKELLLQIKDYYFRKKYLLRIQERIDRFAAR